jgi:hypothetical protein
LLVTGVLFLLVIGINIPFVQNYAAKKAVIYFSKKLHTRVTLQNIRFHLLNSFELENLYIADQQGDTLLYTGSAELKITDWFFLRKKPVISYIGLKNAVIYLNRPANSAQWNYDFVTKLFASPTTDKKEKSAGSLEIDLRKVALVQVHFYSRDQWLGSDMEATVGALDLHADQIDLKHKKINLNAVFGEQVTFGMLDYPAGRPIHLKPKPSNDVDTTPFNPELWQISLKKLQIKDSRFYLEKPRTKAPKGLFDENHLNITDINLSVVGLKIIGDTITAKLNKLSARERCGLEIKQMTAAIRVSPTISECRDLYLETNNSILKDYYAMHYERFPDFLDYIDKVKMSGTLRNSEVGLEDIAYFAPELKRFDNLSVKISGVGSGTVARLSAHDLLVDDGISKLSGSLNMNGLPDINNTFIDFRNGHLRTSGKAALFYAPRLALQRSVNIGSLQSVDFKGNFTGFLTDFVAYGTFVTNLGNLRADLNMKLPKQGRPAYSGSVAATDFDIGTLLYQDYIGTTSFSAELAGSGFNQKTVALKVDGSVAHLFLNDYDYHQINVSGKLNHQLFDGILNVNDPNVALEFKGAIDFQKADPLYDFEADIRRLNLKAIHFSEENLEATARMKLNLRGHNIDDFTGQASIYQINVLRDKSRLNLDSLQLVSEINKAGKKQLTLSTNGLYAGVFGDFTIMELPHSIQMFLSYYLPQYVKAPVVFNGKQNFNFEVKAGEGVSDILSLLDKSLDLGNGVRLNGALDMGAQQLTLNGVIPRLRYKKLEASDVQISSNGNYSGLQLDIAANGMRFAEDDLLSTVQFSTKIFQDSARFQLQTTSPTSLQKANLNGLAYAQNDSFFLNIMPSRFSFNNNQWDIAAGNNLVFSKKYLSIDNLQLQSGLQHIFINTSGKSGLKDNQTVVTIENLDIAPLNNLLALHDLNVDGIVNGTIVSGPLMASPVFKFDLLAENISLNNDTIGTINASGKFDFGKDLLVLDPESGINYGQAHANVSGSLDLSAKDAPSIAGQIRLKSALVKWLSPFLAGYVHQISGTINGSVNFGGPANKPETSGTLNMENLGFTPDITGVHYEIKSGTVQITPGRFEMGDILVYDDSGNTGVLSGAITHNQLNDLNFRLRMNSDHIQVLNLNKYENEHFYGNVYSAVQMRVSGSVDDLNMTVFATPVKESKLYIPINSGSDFGEYNYISFKKYGTEQHTTRPRNKNKFSFRLDAIATPDLETTIILDPATGDQIWAKGSGNVILDIPSDGEIKMNGNYIINEGTYDFSFKQLQILNYHRQFTINSGSIIKWNGDITDADLDVSAYATVKARLYDLIQSESDRLKLSPPEVQDAQIKQDVNVLMKMKGSLTEPDLTFKIELVEGRSIGTYAYQELQRINADEKKTLIQVSSLLLLDQFVPLGGINSSAISSGTINNMSELFSSAASSQITNFANKILGIKDLTIGVRYKNYSYSDDSDPATSIGNINRNEAGINLRTNFLNDRLIVEAGGVYDWGKNTGQGNYTDNLAGDFRVQYLLSPDGRIRFSIFRTSDYDAIYLRKNVDRQGVGISYRKSFNGFKDFFASHLRQYPRPKTEDNNTPATPPPARIDSTKISIQPPLNRPDKQGLTL